MANESKTQSNTCKPKDNGLSGGQIALIILAGVLIIGLIAALIAWLVRSGSKSKSSSKTNNVIIGGSALQNGEIQKTDGQNLQSQTNQQAPAVNQQTTPIMQNNVAQPIATTAPSNTPNNVILPLNPYVQQNNAPAQDYIINETMAGKTSNENILQVPQIIANKTENVGDAKPNETEKVQQQAEQSDVSNIFTPKLFDGFPNGTMINNSINKDKNNNNQLKFPADFASQQGDFEKIIQAGGLNNPLEQLPLEKEADNINGLKEPQKQEQALKDNSGNNITDEMPKLDFAQLLGLPPMKKEPVNEPKLISNEAKNNIDNPNKQEPEMKFDDLFKALNLNEQGANDIANNKNVFAPEPQIEQPVSMNNQKSQMTPPNKYEEPVKLPESIDDEKENSGMASPIFNFMPQPKNNNQPANTKKAQVNGLSTMNNEQPVNNMMTFNMMPEQPTKGNNVSDSVPLPMMESPIKEDNINYNNPFSENITPPIGTAENTNAAPKSAIQSNPMFNQLPPINEDDIKPDAPIFGPSMMENEQNMADGAQKPFMIQPPKAEPKMAKPTIPEQMMKQDKGQESNDKNASEDVAFNQTQQMEANNKQPSTNLNSQCTCALCTGGGN